MNLKKKCGTKQSKIKKINSKDTQILRHKDGGEGLNQILSHGSLTSTVRE